MINYFYPNIDKSKEDSKQGLSVSDVSYLLVASFTPEPAPTDNPCCMPKHSSICCGITT